MDIYIYVYRCHISCWLLRHANKNEPQRRESEHWSGELDTTVTKGSGENGGYIISYKRDNLEDVKWSKININDGKMIRQEDGLTSKSIHFPIIISEGSMVSTEDDQTVVIEWKDTNGKKHQEDMILKAK